MRLMNSLRVQLARCLGVGFCVLLLAGCAAEMTYREGQQLAAQGQSEQALERFEAASGLDRDSAEYRIAVHQTRDALIQKTLAQARNFLSQQRHEEARTEFEKILKWQPGHSRALEGLQAVADDRRHEKWLQSAQGAIKQQDNATARQWLRMVLNENPTHRRAQQLLQDISQESPKKTTATTLSQAYRKAITIEFKDAPLKSVFEVISRTSGLNFLFDKDVRTDQKTSIFLRNSTIEAAVQLTLLTNQLEQRVLDENTILIYPNTQAKLKDYQNLTVKAFYLGNAEAKTVANTLKSILKTRDIVVDDKLNMIILRDSPQAIRMASKLVAMHDVAESEVMLEVEILEVKRTRLLDLGIRWPEQLSLTPLASSTSGALTLADLRALNKSTMGVGIGATTINAKKSDSDANILANPRIRVRNREKAKILIGDRVPNITSTSTATGFVSESVTYVDVGLKLDVEPTISIDGEVAIKIALEVSSVTNQVQTKSGSLAYQIGTRTAQTILRLKDGENQVLAGLINSEDRQNGNKVPGLGEIPVVGRLFGEQRDDNSKTEIVLSITPRILRNITKPDSATLEFDSGTESKLGADDVVETSVAASTGGMATASKPVVAAPATTQPSKVSATGEAAPVGQDASGKPAGIQFALKGPGAAIKSGDVFSVELVLQDAPPLLSLPVVLGFDARSLQVLGIQEGAFFKKQDGGSRFTSRVDPAGLILLTATRSAEGAASGQGVVATIQLKATATAPQGNRLRLVSAAPVGQSGPVASPTQAAALNFEIKP